MACIAASRKRIVCVAAPIGWWRSLGSVSFKLDSEAASHIAALAAADAKTRGSISGIAGPSLKLFKSELLYKERVVPALIDEFEYPNMDKVPFLDRVVVNCNFRRDRMDATVIENTRRDLYILTGQRPKIFQAKLALQGSAYRVGDPVGCFVTLRKERMYAFLDRLLSLIVPTSRTVQGDRDKVDYGFIKGSYNLGVKDYSSITESRLDHIYKPMGLRIALVTGANSTLEARRLLMLMGLPYTTRVGYKVKKSGKKGARRTVALTKQDKKKSAAKAKGKKKK